MHKCRGGGFSYIIQIRKYLTILLGSVYCINNSTHYNYIVVRPSRHYAHRRSRSYSSPTISELRQLRLSLRNCSFAISETRIYHGRMGIIENRYLLFLKLLRAFSFHYSQQFSRKSRM